MEHKIRIEKVWFDAIRFGLKDVERRINKRRSEPASTISSRPLRLSELETLLDFVIQMTW